jgi:chromosome partitioning protein
VITVHTLPVSNVHKSDPSGSDLVGIQEIARLAGVTRQAVANWRSRFPDFPKPLVDLSSGPVFRRDQVRNWLRKRRIPMATIISTINLKGGVGKTTTTVAIAEILAGEFRKKVLLVDLDPQTNATIMLISEEQWLELNEKGLTLAQLFKDAVEPEDRRFDLERTLQRKVSNVTDVHTLSLLPSSLDLIDVQDRLASMPSGRFFANNPIEILSRAVRPIIDEFDFVLIDCPPNLGIITLNGLRMSHGYIIPTIPDILSTYGIPQIVNRVGEFAESIGENIEPLGIAVCKYQGNSTVHNNTIRRLRSQSSKDAPLFSTVIPQSNDIADAAEFTPVSTLRQKWGYRGQFDAYKALTREILQKVSA